MAALRWRAGVVAESDGDVGDTGQALGGKSNAAECGQDLWAGGGADLGAVLVEGDVADPVSLFQPGWELGWSTLGVRLSA